MSNPSKLSRPSSELVHHLVDDVLEIQDAVIEVCANDPALHLDAAQLDKILDTIHTAAVENIPDGGALAEHERHALDQRLSKHARVSRNRLSSRVARDSIEFNQPFPDAAGS